MADETPKTDTPPEPPVAPVTPDPETVAEAIKLHPTMGARGLWERYEGFQETDYQKFAAEWTAARAPKAQTKK